MSALSFEARLQELSQEVSSFQMEMEDPTEYSVLNLPLLSGRLAELEKSFANLQTEADGLYSRQLGQIRTDLRNAASRVEQVRSRTFSNSIGGPATRGAIRNFSHLETTGQMLIEGMKSHKGPLTQTDLEVLGIYCQNARLQLGNNKRFKEPTEELTDEWFKTASKYKA